MEMDELTQFYASYFADQSTDEGAREIVSVYSQSAEMRRRVLENLNQIDQLIENHDAKVLDIFEETCLFGRTGDQEEDFQDVKVLADDIKAFILESRDWQITPELGPESQ